MPGLVGLSGQVGGSLDGVAQAVSRATPPWPEVWSAPVFGSWTRWSVLELLRRHDRLEAAIVVCEGDFDRDDVSVRRRQLAVELPARFGFDAVGALDPHVIGIHAGVLGQLDSQLVL